ncbi:MAG: hypothetical protein PHH49_04990 [Candidatus Omnitrophica bacterium]|nr:hypothetical protein [Candidatus Omnitrophota bacterium]MDD5488301.1 hypothetical protein [Candidatus Omnitrophota bacterium]
MSDLKDKIQPGDVILTCGKGVVLSSLLIKVANFFKRGYASRGWTHAALYLGKDEVVEAFPGGIVRRNFTEAYLGGNFELLVLRRKNITQESLGKMIDFCVNEKGEKYDFRGLVYFLLFNLLPHQFHFLLDNKFMGGRFNVEEAYFCSELIATGFEEAGVYCFEREPYKVMPIDYFNTLLFEKIAILEFPKKENKIIWHCKKIVFFTTYLIAAILFPLILILIGIGIILLLSWVVHLIVALLLLLSKKAEKDKEK